MNKKKKIIIITITVVIVLITGIIVGISVNKHNTAVKEALSVSESKEDLCHSFEDEFNAIVDKEYKTAEEYESAKNALIKIKDKINVSDIKEDERLVSMISDIDKTIAEYDKAIAALTATEATTEAKTESTTEKVTEKATDKPFNATTKSGSSSNKPSTKSNKSNNTTTKAQAAKQTTTKKYKPAPAYGTVVTSRPNPNDYEDDNFHNFTAYYTWDGNTWYLSSYSTTSSMGAEKAYKYVSSYLSKPNKSGKYVGEETEVVVWIWG